MSNLVRDILALDRILHVYTRRYYFSPNVPIEKQRHYSAFRRIAIALRETGVSARDFIRMTQPRRNTLPQYLASDKILNKLRSVVEQSNKKKSRTTTQLLAADKDMIRQLVQTTHQNPLYIINMFWGQLHPSTREHFARFHNPIFLEAGK
jgi:hypothetical protein